ncbi:Probable RNA-directed DNA polymerase from transposon X-element [Anthophora plagiata]
MKTIIQWNINGYYAHYEQLQILLKLHNPDILCLQETNFKKNHLHTLKHYSTFAKNRANVNHASGGVAIAVSNNYISSEIPLSTTLEAIAVAVSLPYKIHICSIYLPNSFSLELEELEKLIEQIPTPLILAGDFNSHSSLWGSSKSDSRGKKIEKLLENPNLILLNTGTPTHFSVSNGKTSAIDLTICSPRLSQYIKWETLNNLHDSDHFPIKISYEDNIPSFPTTHQTKWNIQKTNWPTFQSSIRYSLEEKGTVSEIDPNQISESINEFETIIQTAANLAFGTIKTKNNRKRTVPWWNEECKAALQENHHAFNRAKKHPTPENLIEFKQKRAKFRKIIKENKKVQWRTYVSSITDQTPTTEIWRKIKQISGRHSHLQIKFLETDPNQFVTLPNDIANCLAEKFKSNSSNNNYDPTFLANISDLENPLNSISSQSDEITMNTSINDPICINEIKTILPTTKSSAPGPDNIPNILLKMLPESGISHLLKIFNCIWIHKVFPDNWRKAIVIPILKPNKDKQKSESYRPISLTNTMCKLLEKIINKRLRWYLETNNLLTPIQYGFRHHRSTIDVLTNIEACICDAFQKGEYLMAVCLDIEKAYDMIWKPKIINTLIELNVNGSMLAFVENFLSNRTIQVKTNGTLSKPTKIENGVPQGSVMSVTLFLIGINDIANNLKAPVKALLFADDLTLICNGNNLISIKDHLQTSIYLLKEWSNKSGLKFSTQKSQCILFTRKTKYQTLPIIKMGETELPFVNNIRLLGLILDKKMTWTPHMKYLKESCSKRLNILKVLANNSWGADQETLLRTYRAIIRSKLDYGSTVYSSAKQHTLKIIEPIHNSALRIATGVYCTCPISEIQFEAKEMALEARRKFLSLKYAVKISSTPNNPTFKYIFSNRYRALYDKKPKLPSPFYIRLHKILNPSTIEIIPTIERRQSEIAPWTMKLPHTNTSLADLPKNSKSKIEHSTRFIELNSHYDRYNQVFSDASKSESGVGFALIANNKTIKKSLHKMTSIFTAEAYAILEALIHTRTNNLQNLVIYTDSMSVIQALSTAHNSNHELIAYIQETYTELSNNNVDINIVWIPSHQGISGNELADTAAKEATTLPLSQPVTPVPYQDISNHIKTVIKDEWNKTWITHKRSRTHNVIKHFYQPTPDKNLNRKEKAVLSRLRTGHTKITHEHLLKKTEPPHCNRCPSQSLTTDHLLYECTVTNPQRQKYNIKPDTALTDQDHIRNTINYLKDIDMFNKV